MIPELLNRTEYTSSIVAVWAILSLVVKIVRHKPKKAMHSRFFINYNLLFYEILFLVGDYFYEVV